MKTSFIFLFVAIASNSYAAPKVSLFKTPQGPQTMVVFEDHEVPHFVVVERKSKKLVVIDRHSKTISDTKNQR